MEELRERRSRQVRPSVALDSHRMAVHFAAERHKLANPRIFGSTARGADTGGSDLDLLVDPLPNATLFPLMLAVRLAQRATGLAAQARESDLRVPARPVNTVLAGLLSVEALAVKAVDMPIGSSVLCLAQKPA